MIRGEVATRPLLVDVIKRVISYIQSIKRRQDAIAYSAYEYETQSDIEPNFQTYIKSFNLISEVGSEGKIFDKKKEKVTIIKLSLWRLEINESPKAISYKKFKVTVFLE